MNFLEAVKAADKGAKIRLPHWKEGEFLEVYGLMLVWGGTTIIYTPSVFNILLETWEAVE